VSDVGVRTSELDPAEPALRAIAGPPLSLCALGFGDDQTLAVGTVDGRIALYNPTTLELVTVWQAFDGRVLAIAGSADGAGLHAVSESGELVSWDRSGRHTDETVLPGATGRLTAAALSGDRRAPTVAWAAADGEVSWLDDASGVVEALVPAGRRVTALAIRPGDGGRVLACAFADGGIEVHARARPDPTLLAPRGGAVRSARALAFEPGSEDVVSGHEDGRIRRWTADGMPLPDPIDAHSDWVRAVSWIGSRMVSGSDDGTIRLSGGDAGVERISAHSASIRTLCVAAGSDGAQILVSGGTDGVLRFWDVAAGDEFARVLAHDDWVESVASAVAPVDGDADALVSVGRDGAVRSWSPGGSSMRAEQSLGGRLRAVSCADHGRLITVAREDGVVFRGRVGALEHQFRLDDHMVSMSSYDRAEGEPIVVAGGASHIYGWEASSAQASWEQHELPATTRSIMLPSTVEPLSGRENAAVVTADAQGALRVWWQYGEPLVRGEVVSQEPLWAVTGLSDGDVNRYACFGDDRIVRVVRLLDGSGFESRDLAGHTGRGRALAVVSRAGHQLLASGATDGTIRLWDNDGNEVDRWPRLPGEAMPATEARRDITSVGDEEPTDVDELEREVIAAGLATQLRHVIKERTGDAGVLLALIDAPWGVGKTSFLTFLERHLEQPPDARLVDVLDSRPWILPDRPFDAWRESQVGPAWWSIVNHVRDVVRGSMSPTRRARFAVEGFFVRLWHAYRIALLFLVAALAVLTLVGLWVTDHWPFAPGTPSTELIAPTTAAPGSPSTVLVVTTPAATPTTSVITGAPGTTSATGAQDVMNDLASLADATTKLILFGGVLLVGWYALVRIGLWYTPLGARLYQKTNENPMGSVIADLQWTKRQVQRPMLVAIDDLDRCRADYVVAVLEALQTLVRHGAHGDDAGRRRRTSRGTRREEAPLVVVVAADSAWLRSAIEQHYEKFSPDVARPGRSLGWLFLDKLFPVRVRIPDPDRDVVEQFTSRVLEITPAAGGEVTPATIADQRASEERVRSAETMAAKEAAIESAPSSVDRSRLRLEAARTSVSTGTLAEATHVLGEYLPIISRIGNPRTIKRFRNAYLLNRVAFGGKPDLDTITKWTLVEVQWPDLAEQIRLAPRLVEDRPPQWHSRDATDALLRHPDVREVLKDLHEHNIRLMLRLPDNGGGSLEEPRAAGPPGGS
jgi:WD40 repeat protein